MNSFNHYAYGAIGDWMYRVSAGIEASKPGYKQILVQPHLSKKLDFSKAVFESMYGAIASGWERKNGKVIITVNIPANTQAVIELPVDDLSKVTENGAAIKDTNEKMVIAVEDNGKKKFGIVRGSGDYIYEFSE
jgi:alpha-L-rhamnosidase